MPLDTAFRVSVRELVSFTYYPPDLLPGRDAAALMAGTRAHLSRQSALPPEAVTEKSLTATVELDGETITLFGRMDAYTDGEPPYIEEIKLCGMEPPAVPLPEHRAQAALYAAMLCWSEGKPGATVCVRYVSEDGTPRASYEEALTAEAAQGEALRMLAPFLAFARQERAHRLRRDESLNALEFPFATYRPGQREMAVQVYTAITQRKRLYASLPTGTGKSAAVLFPALKALARGKTRKILYLTARGTARQSPLAALERMRAQGMRARVSVLTAREKLCPETARCHPDDCPRARGHFVRQRDALDDILRLDEPWTEAVILRVADAHNICPFEFALVLTELADVVLMDYNYVFDPLAQVQRLMATRSRCTLLVDEAHHLLERAREMYSGEMASGELARHRAAAGKACGRKHAYYRALGDTLRELRLLDLPQAVEPEEPPPDETTALREGRLQELPEALHEALLALRSEAAGVLAHPRGDAAFQAETADWFRRAMGLLFAWERLGEAYAVLLSCRGKSRALSLYCLLPGKEIQAATRRMRGAVFFSATLSPLEAMRALLGGEDGDACFALPSPFPPENLRVVRLPIDTRYRVRDDTAADIARTLSHAVNARPGKYIAYFPSYAYLSLVLAPLSDLPAPPLLVQESEMSEDARERFLHAFTGELGPVLGLCVLGGLFSEGVDLPGDQLIGAFVVGVGLPTPSLKLSVLRACYQQRFGDGFAYACIYPGMQKVLQAAGRVIRSETDKGLVVLMDTRYHDWVYRQLLPAEWTLTDEDVDAALAQLRRLEP